MGGAHLHQRASSFISTVQYVGLSVVAVKDTKAWFVVLDLETNGFKARV